LKILALESSAAPASAAVCDDAFLLGETYVNTRKMHSQTLMPMAQGLLDTCGVKLRDIGLFAVDCGPGSFTGVRIGVSAVKGMAVARGTPCAAVSSLAAIALNLENFDGIVCAVMDARRSQFYNALFAGGTDGMRRLTDDRAVALAELESELHARAAATKKSVILVGDGAKVCYNSLRATEGVLLAPEHLRYQRAACVAALGLEALRKGAVTDAQHLLPVYLRLPQAERELKMRREENRGV
jgi:tRNA threonylcarbamoyladenosine biosynthesis protein TsaB